MFISSNLIKAQDEPRKNKFSQIMDYAPKNIFDQLVSEYKGNYRFRTFSCWDQLLCLAFAQLTFRESLRDIETCLRSNSEKLYHMGIKGNILQTQEKGNSAYSQVYK